MRVVSFVDPVNPIVVGGYDTPFQARGIFALGDYAYIADHTSIQIIDVSNPAVPTLQGTVTIQADNIFVLGNYAFVANGESHLPIIDLSNTSNIGYFPTSGFTRGVFAVGNYVYVADDQSGLEIGDLTYFPDPTPVGFYDTPGNSYDLYVSGDYAYVADGSAGLQIINVSNPSNPTLTGSLPSWGTAYDVSVVGDYAFVAKSAYIQVVDVSDPADPVEVASYYMPYDTKHISTSGSFIHAADRGSYMILSFPATGIEDDPLSPTYFMLSQNYPNPFNASTRIPFSLPGNSDVLIEIYNLLGQKVAELFNGSLEAGYHIVSWDAGNESSGLYFYRIKAGDKIDTRQMILLK